MPDRCRRLAKVLGILAVVALSGAALRRLLGGTTATPTQPPADWTPLEDDTGPPARTGPLDAQHAVEEDTVPDDAGEHEAAGPDDETDDETDADAETDEATTWVEPKGGACPVSHPVKVKTSSGIFHVPGGANYERTSPDRCYTTAAAAEADGYRAAKR